MPGYPQPVGSYGGLPPFWNATIQGIQHAQRMGAALAAGATQGSLPDRWGNATEVSGSNLDQEVTIGADHLNAGVLVRTGIAPGTSGRAVLSGPAITTITLTAGSTSATVGTVTGAALSKGQVIGAASVNDPSSGTATPAIVPGTTIASVSGTSVTLSQNAAESGTSLYCAAARFILQQDSGWVPLTLGANVSAWTGIPAARLYGDSVRLTGIVVNSVAISAGSAWVTLPASMTPATLKGGVVGFNSGSVAPTNYQINTSGALSLLTNVTTSNPMFLDSVYYSLT